MKKSITKRVRITKTGKIMRRRMAQGHFRAGKTGDVIRKKRGPLKVSESDVSKIKSYAGRLGGVGKKGTRKSAK